MNMKTFPPASDEIRGSLRILKYRIILTERKIKCLCKTIKLQKCL